MNEEELNELKLKMSLEVPNQPTVIKTQLPLDNDTSFDIYFDIFNGERKKYLYIKLIENSAVAPFYYNRSYTIEELRKLNNIFMAVDMDQTRKHLKDLFDKKKVELSPNQETGGITMILEVGLFATVFKIKFELYKEMIPENEKDEQLINLYKVEIKNKTEKKLTPDNIKFKLDKKSSNAFCKDITFLFYEKDKYQKGIITFYFDEDTEPGEHKCIFDVFIDGKQLKDYQYILNITIPEKE